MKAIVALLARTAEGAILTNPEGKVVFWNKAAERLLGYRPKDVLGRPCHEVMRGVLPNGKPLCSPSCSVFTSLAHGKAVRHFEAHTTTASGQPIWLSVSSLCIPAQGKDQCSVVHLFHDNTKQVKVRRLAQALYTAVCSHPLVTPLPHNPPVSVQVQTQNAFSCLSRREQEILSCLKSGLSTSAIADRLCISPVTVRNHIQHILEKLGVHSRLEAVAMASARESTLSFPSDCVKK